MLYFIATLLLPPLLVFGLYHLATWFNVGNVNHYTFWKRVAAVSVISHLLLVTGFLAFAFFDFERNRQLSGTGLTFGTYLFAGSQFWRLMLIFDTVPMLVLLALFWLMDRAGVNIPGLVAITIVVTYIVGSVQWYFLGGVIGGALERFWSSLKTGDDDDSWYT